MILRFVLCLAAVLSVCVARGEVRVRYDDSSGAAGATLAPVSVKLALPDSLKGVAKAGLEVPCFDNYETALAQPDIDIVSICTPQQVHADERPGYRCGVMNSSTVSIC